MIAERWDRSIAASHGVALYGSGWRERIWMIEERWDTSIAASHGVALYGSGWREPIGIAEHGCELAGHRPFAYRGDAMRRH
jgi:hypothetical protein